MENIRIQDNLYEYVNKEWLDQAVIPDDKPTTGGFADLDSGVEKLMINEFKEMSKSGVYPNEHMKNACELFKIASNVKKRNKDGIKPVLKTLAKIYKLNDVKGLNRNLYDFLINGYPLPFNIMISPNMKDAVNNAIYIQGPSTILPDVTYYKEEMKAQHDAMIGMWTNFAKMIIAKTTLTAEEQEEYIKDALAFDAIIATLVKSSEEWSDYPAIYNPMKASRVASLMKPLKIKKLIEKTFEVVPENIIVADPRFLKGFKTLFNEENFNLYKHWAYVTGLLEACPLLSEELRELGGAFRRALMGVAKAPDVDKYAYHLAGGMFSQPVGLYYGDKYFGEEAKKDIVSMVKEIIETYKVRVNRNEFLSPETKAKAIVKLNAIKIKMGYPDKVEAIYDALVVDPKATLFANVTNLEKIKRLDSYADFKKPVDKTKWAMPGHMVNACYDPFSNDITFPAAILQAPFYSIKQTRSQNLGGIGAVIGHEISHAFDNNGAKCDENGNLFNWWTKEDTKKFNAKTKAMVKEFDGIELPWGKVNGAFIVSENIADNGGMAVTLEIMSGMKDANYEEYFTNWAKVWCMKGKPEYLAMLLQVDVHAPVVLRANMQPRNFEEWYKTFDVKKTDGMYLAPNKRVVIW